MAQKLLLGHEIMPTQPTKRPKQAAVRKLGSVTKHDHQMGLELFKAIKARDSCCSLWVMARQQGFLGVSEKHN